MESFLNFPKTFENKKLDEKWNNLINIRNLCNISIEEKRSKKEIGSSLEASLILELDDKNYESFSNVDFSELCITSEAKVKKSSSNKINISTIKAEGKKCPVCWKISLELCKRHNS